MGGTEHSYYELLGVPETATSAEIVSAYRQISRRVHPDVAGDTAAGLFRLIQHAREVLTDPARRAAYDRERAAPRSDPPRPQPAPPTPPPPPPPDYVAEDWSPPPTWAPPPPSWAAPPPYAAPGHPRARWTGTDPRFAGYLPIPGDRAWQWAGKALCRTALRLRLPHSILGWLFALIAWSLCIVCAGTVVAVLPPEVRPWLFSAVDLLMTDIPMLLLIVRLWIWCRRRYIRRCSRREARQMQ
jgi:hypothetical protein